MDTNKIISLIILNFFLNVAQANQCTCTIFYNCPQLISSTVALANFPKCADDYHYLCCSNTSTAITTKPKKQCGQTQINLKPRLLNPAQDLSTPLEGEMPWLVEIFNQNQLKCYGSLIHPRVVLTATHCIFSYKEEELTVVAPSTLFFQKIGDNPNSDRAIFKIITHPNFNSGTGSHNIALLILQTPYSYENSSLNSICLPEMNEDFDDKICTLASWGQNKNLSAIQLKKVSLPIVNPQKCQELLRNIRRKPNYNLHNSFLCAGGEKGKGSCMGDGGAPLVCLDSNYRLTQAGINSWGLGCGQADSPHIFTNVAKFNRWIHNALLEFNIKIGNQQ